jgi:O-methyltransferase
MIKNLLSKILKSESEDNTQHADFTANDWEIINFVKPYTMTSVERLKSLIDAVQYVANSRIEGDFVECGTWKGGSVMCMQKKLIGLNQTDRNFWVFDTFEGMPEPDSLDKNFKQTSAQKLMNEEEKEKSLTWAYSNYEETTSNILSAGYPAEKINFIKGLVEDTIPQTPINKIAILRLDTDWYSSTKFELEQLYPKLVKGGVLIIDDYGHWEGCKKAVDEYFTNNNISVFMNRIDYTGRLIIKP